MAFFNSATPNRTKAKPIAPDHQSPLAHALISLEKRYVFDAALATELASHVAPDAALADDVSRGPSLGTALVAAAEPVATPAPGDRDDTSVLDGAADATAGRAIYFIDGNVDQREALLAGLPAGAEVVILDPARDGIAQIAAAMTGRSGIDQVHIFAHGGEGTLSLGSGVLDAQSMNGIYRATLAGIGTHLGDNADILVYGCNFAEGADGAAAADLLSALTRADVAASTDLTGAARLGADWSLEYQTGSIESRTLSFDGFDATLDVASISASGVPSTNGLHNVGASATWSNVATVGGQPVDIRATVIAADASANITFGTTGDDLRMELENGTATVQWDLLLAGTGTAIAADVNFQITDLDGPNIESVSASTGFTVDANTNLAVSTLGAVVTAAGTQNQNSEPVSMIRFSWTGVSSMTVDYTATSGNDIRIFNHDGDLDLAFANPVTVGTPILDLDTGTGGIDYATTFTEGGAGVSITDPTVSITNSTNIQTATIVLTNAQAGDSLTLGTLPGGISGSVDTSVPGQITVTLTGNTTAANYQTALNNITFANSSNDPDTTPRTVTFELANIAYTSATSTTTINVVPVNDPPVATDDGYATTVNTGVSGDVSGNDSDPDGNPLTFALATGPAHGSVTLNPNGTFTYTPNGGYAGSDSFTYTADDGNGGTDTATVTITIAGAPVAGDDAVSTSFNTAVSGSVATNDSDPNGDTLTYVVATAPTNGNVTLNPNGTFTYTPNGGYSGTDTFTYTVSDGNGGTDTATVTVTVGTNPNLPPVAGDDSFSTGVNIAVSGTVATNDSDANGDTLTYAVAAGPTNGNVTLNPNGSFSYSPNAGYAGADTFTYTVSDGNGGTDTATVTITMSNGAPVAGDDAVSTSFNTAVSGNVATNDSDPNGDTLTYVVATAPTNGNVTLNPNGTFTYTPNGGYSGTDTFTYTVSDGNGGTDTATVTVTVGTNPNLPPVAGDDSFSTGVNIAVSGTVATNDSDANGDTLTYAVAAGPTNGNVTLNPNGSFSYSPNAGYAGADTFTYTVSDGNGGTDTATVTITMSNGAPVAGDDAVSTNYNTAIGGSVATNDSDPNGDTLTYVVATGPTNGSVTLNPNGTFTYTPNGGYSGTDTFTYTVSDGNGGTDTATVTVTVGTNPNLPPVAGDDSFSTGVNIAVSGTVATNDSDANGDTLTYAVATGPTNGNVTLNPNGSFSYSPNAGYAGADTFTYTVSDGNGGTDTATVTITMSNGAPVAGDDAVSTNYNTAIGGSVATNDSDPNGDTLTYVVATAPTNGNVTLNPNGTFTYTPNGGYSGTDTFTYTVSDGNGGTDTATVTVTVAPRPNTAPVAVNDSFSTDSGTSVSGSVAGNDSDPEGDALSFAVDTGPAHGSVTVNPDGTFTYLPTPGYSGSDTFTYRVTDSFGASSTATVTLTVVNRPPVATGAIPGQANVDLANVSVAIGSYFSDPDGGALTFGASGLPGGLSINPTTGIISGTIANDASGVIGAGSYSVTITATDPAGGATTQTFLWRVDNVAPVAVNDSFAANSTTPVSGSVATNDTDADNDAITYALSGQTANGTVVFNSNGSFTYTANPLFGGTDTFTYIMQDANGGTSTATVSIQVTAPTALPPTIKCITTFGDLSYLRLLLTGSARVR